MRTLVGVILLVLAFAAASPAQVCDEQVVFQVHEGTIEIFHDQALYNCCAWIGFESYQEGQSIDIVEWEHLDPPGGCDCVCCFDTHIVMGGLAPGVYQVTITKRYEEDGSEVLGPWEVEVEGSSDPVLIMSYLPCATASVHDQTTTWGIIKSYYR
jgi:hypothetical protein